MNSTLCKGSEAAFDFHCDLCDKDNNYVEAIGYCVDCEDYLCQECFKHHLKPKPMRHHVLLDQHKMPKNTSSQRQSKDMCTEPCGIHKHDILQYYCAGHSQFGCGICMTLHHRKCEGVDYIPDIARDVLTTIEYKDLHMKMKYLTKTAQQAINATQAKTKTTNLQQSDATEFFKQMRKKLVAAVDRLEHVIMKDAGKIRDENQEKIKSVEKQYNKLLKDIEALDSKFTSLENKGQFCQIFLAMKRSKDEIAALKTSLLKLQDQSNITEYVIKMNDDLQQLIQNPKNMASFEIINKPQSTLHAAAGTAVRKSVEYETTAAVHVADFGVRIKEDGYDPCISGSVVLSGDKVVIVDSNNNTLKLLNLQSNKSVSHLRYNRGLWDITAVTNTHVAVTCARDRTILFINVTNTLTVDHKEKVNGKCRGIACISDKLVITYVNPAKVEIISQTGELLQTVVTEERGKQLFSSPKHVTVSPDQQTIYISDWDMHTVTSLDLNGQIKATYKDDELTHPHGLTVDRASIVYVCGYCSNNIHQLTPDLHKINILLQESDGILKPLYVSFNEEQNELYIGMWDSDIVKVYQLL